MTSETLRGVPFVVKAYVVVTNELVRRRRLITLSELEAKSEAAQIGGTVSETWALVVDTMVWPLAPPLALGPREGEGDLL